jgi:uncharacterized protein (TIGR03000 family)
MFGKALSFGGLLLLSGALVLGTAGSVQAQHHGGGGHGGGGHGGGGHGGGFHGGGHGGGFHGGGFHGGGFHHGGFNHGGFHHGGFNHGGFHSGFHHGDFRHGDFRHGDFRHGDFRHGFHHGFHHGGIWWYPGLYGGYGAWPYNYGYYPSYGYSDYYPNTYSSDWSSPEYDSGYYGSYGGVTSSYPDIYSPATAQPDTRAQLIVNVPADAEIWFEGTKMTSTGSVREFQSPPLTAGTRYTYEVRARWNENGQEVTQTQEVKVTAGANVNVKFPVQPTKAATAPSK